APTEDMAAVLGELEYPVIAGVGDVDVAGGVDSQPGRVRELQARLAAIPLAQYGAEAVEPLDPVVAGFRDIDLALALGDGDRAVEPPGPVAGQTPLVEVVAVGVEL